MRRGQLLSSGKIKGQGAHSLRLRVQIVFSQELRGEGASLARSPGRRGQIATSLGLVGQGSRSLMQG